MNASRVNVKMEMSRGVVSSIESVQQAFTWECPHDAIRIHVHTNITEKCNLYHNLVDQGLVPTCADNICLVHISSTSEKQV